MMDAASAADVSRETMDRLIQYAALLEKWNPRINLVSKSSLQDLWKRHIMDSMQVLSLAPPRWSHWVDLGSGGGFPGLVVAIASIEKMPNATVTLVESDQRKSAFLRTVIRETNANARVIAQRIEDVPPLNADVVSARALADLGQLLGFFERHAGQNAIGLFPKGATWQKELAAARREWDFSAEPCKSETDEEAVILKIEGVARV